MTYINAPSKDVRDAAIATINRIKKSREEFFEKEAKRRHEAQFSSLRSAIRIVFLPLSKRKPLTLDEIRDELKKDADFMVDNSISFGRQEKLCHRIANLCLHSDTINIDQKDAVDICYTADDKIEEPE